MKNKKIFIIFLTFLSLLLVSINCQSKVNNDISNVSQKDYNKLFELNLYSDKQIYKSNEKITIWSTLKYIGKSKQIKIWHGIPYINFYISNGKEFNIGGIVNTILAFTILDKDKLYKFNYVKNGGYDANDPKADYWKKFYNEKDLYLPKGEYTVKVGGGFRLTQDLNKDKSNLKAKEIKIKVEK